MKPKKKPRRLIRRFWHKANSRKKMVVELWLNLEILERSLSEKEEKARLIRELINTIERNEIIVGKVDDIEYLKVSN
jgi:CII-binding regulator of phage lambda lysogenization HflD